MKSQNDKSSIHKNSDQLVLTDHAIRRWGQRVGQFNNKSLLKNKINMLYSLLGRVELLTPEIGLIDKEILFTYERLLDKTIITTFYGRLSQNPSLNQFDTMRNYNFHKDDYIELSLDNSVLSRLLDPPIPTQRMIFKGSTSRYMIDKYSDDKRSLFILLVLEGQERGALREIYSDQPKCEKIEKSVRQALLLLGQDEFVYNHVAYHYPDELHKRLNRIKRQ